MPSLTPFSNYHSGKQSVIERLWGGGVKKEQCGPISLVLLT